MAAARGNAKQMHAVQSSSTLSQPSTHNQPPPPTSSSTLPGPTRRPSPGLLAKTQEIPRAENQSWSTRLTSLSNTVKRLLTLRFHASSLVLSIYTAPPSSVIMEDHPAGFPLQTQNGSSTRALAALSNPSPSADFPAPSGSLLASC
jgi:hypothetical protein